MTATPIVVKVGGSLFDLPQLGRRLRSWLDALDQREVLLVPGGGRIVDVIRTLDKVHQLGEEASHWLALRAISLNAYVLAELLPRSSVVTDVASCQAAWSERLVPILDAYSFVRADEWQLGSLPHCWTVSSDSVAARVARLCGAGRLILLKSIDIPSEMSWDDAAQRGWVDGAFAHLIADVGSRLSVSALNFRRSNTQGNLRGH